MPTLLKTIRLILLILYLPSAIMAQDSIAVDGSQWMYLNEGPVSKCTYIHLITKGDTLLTLYPFDSTKGKVSVRKLAYRFLDADKRLLKQQNLLLWNDGRQISYFFDTSGINLRESDHNFLYTWGKRFNEQWHVPMNDEREGWVYDAFKILSRDTFYFNDSVSSLIYTFESTPMGNYLCETVIPRVGSMGFMLPVNRNKPNYSAGKLLWYYDPAIDTFWVPDSFGCDLSYTSVPEITNNPSLKIYYKGNGCFQYLIPDADGGTLLVYSTNGKLLKESTRISQLGELYLPARQLDVLLFCYRSSNGLSAIQKICISE
ncbi:hypothetical protein GC194_08360 [bacterium]|nr:hypothetical protein [bacterium]